MKPPTTYEVNTPRQLVLYLTKLVGEVNDNSLALIPLKEQAAEVEATTRAQKQAKTEAQSKVEAKAQAKADKFAEAKRIVAAAEARLKAKEQAKANAKTEAKELLEARKLLGIKETENEM